MPRRLVLAAVLAGLTLAGPAPAQYFGKNKVHYEHFDWKVLETPHFRVHYYTEESQTAFDAARMAERSYARLSHVLRHDFTRPIPLVLYASHSQFQQTNILQELIDEGTGGVTEFAKQRVLLPFTGSYAELEHVLSHELVHAFQIDILYGRNQALLANPFAFSPPGWFMEGMAEYLSLGGVDVNTEMWLRDAALQGYLIPIETLGYVGDIRVYRFGQSIWEYVARRYGEDKISELLHKAGQSRNVDRAFEYVLGITLEKLSDDWQENIRITYLPQIARYRKVSDFGRRLTRHEKDGSNMNVVPALSPTGDKLSFVSDRELTLSLYLGSAIDGRILGRLAEGERKAEFESFRFFTSSADWSPDGKLVAVPAKAGARDVIYLFDAARRKVARRIEIPDVETITSPSWSPDGARLVFSADRGGQSDLYLVSADGSGLERLTSDRFADRQPRWSPDGKTVAFVTDRGPGTDIDQLVFARDRIALFDLSKREVTLLPGMTGKNINPQWSADGRELLFVSDRTGINNLFVINVSTGEVRQVSDLLTGISGITEGSPPLTVSRDGRRAVFSAFEKAGWDLYAVKDPFLLPPVTPLPPPPAAPPALAAVDTTVNGPPVVVPPMRGEPGGLGRVALSLPPAPVNLPDSTTDLAHLPLRDGGAPAPKPAPGDSAARPPVFPPVAPPAGITAPPPDSAQVAASLDSLRLALNVLPDTLAFRRAPYRTHFSTDYSATTALVGSSGGLAGMAGFSFSDMLGNRTISVAAGIYGSLEDSDIFLQYIDQSRRTNFGVAAFQYRNDLFILSRPTEDEYQSEIFRGAEFFFWHPTDKFHRLELSLRAVTVKEKRLIAPIDQYHDEVIAERPTYGYIEPGLAFVKDTALYGSTGPMSGTRARLSVSQAIGGGEFTDVLVDYRHYFNFARRYALAWRVTSANSLGQDASIYYAGGAFTSRTTDTGDIEGSRILLSNLELRVPFIDRLTTSFPLPLDWPGMRGALFFDLGAGWGERFDGSERTFQPFSTEGGLHTKDLTAAYGFGLRMGFGFLILRYDVAQATDLKQNLGQARHFFSLGADF